MERKVIFSDNVETYLKRLVDTLYEQKYFGFKQDAKIYVQQIVLFVMNNDFNVNVRYTPQKFQKFGKKFLRYKANNKTSWYIFFDQKGNQFLINHILNNHSQGFPDLI